MANIKIYVAGHKGMLGSAIVRLLKKKNGVDIIIKDRSELDLTNQSSVENFFKVEKPDQVYMAAARVGGIGANSTFSAEFIYENIIIEANIIHASFLSGVKKLLFLGSSSVYPKFVDQPIKEEELLKGPLEPTNEAYAIAKISGIKMCEYYNYQYFSSHGIDYRSVVPTNLYGPGEHYDLNTSHVVPALIRKFHEAKIRNERKVTVWGTGNSRREFLYVDDCAKACHYIMSLDHEIYNKTTKPFCSHINIGFGSDLTIKELAKNIKDIINYSGEVEFDLSKPDGMKRKFIDSKRIHDLGWRPEVSLKEGLKRTYEVFKKEYEKII